MVTTVLFQRTITSGFLIGRIPVISPIRLCQMITGTGEPTVVGVETYLIGGCKA